MIRATAAKPRTRQATPLPSETWRGLEHCPECDHNGVTVCDSRPSPSGRTRRKRCRSCGHRWSTIEVKLTEAGGILADAAMSEAQQALLNAEMTLRDLRIALEEQSG